LNGSRYLHAPIAFYQNNTMSRSILLFIVALIVAFSAAAQNAEKSSAAFLTTTWKLRSEAIDANKNNQLDESEKMPVAKEKVAYKFNEDGTGTYDPGSIGRYPGTPSKPPVISITWKLSAEGDQLTIVMNGATFRYHIQELDKKHLVLETKTVDGKGWEIYGRKIAACLTFIFNRLKRYNKIYLRIDVLNSLFGTKFAIDFLSCYICSPLAGESVVRQHTFFNFC